MCGEIEMDRSERRGKNRIEKLKRSVGLEVLGLIIAFLSLRGYSQQYPGHDAATTGASTGSSGYSRFWGNPACAAADRRWTAGHYLFDPFLLKELMVKGVGLTIPLGSGSVIGSYLSEGFGLFQRQSISTGYSRVFGKALTAGMTINYLSLKLGQEYGAISGAAAQLGILIDLSGNLKAGAYTFFPSGGNPCLKECFQPFSVCSIQWNASGNLSVTAEFAKEAESPLLIRGALCYKDVKYWMLQGGMNFFPTSFFAGAGFNVRNFSVVMSSVYQSPLGFSPSITIIYGKK
ncbi:MAG: hypothetical protein AB9842_12490 [Bacteroidales bacterium]